MKRFPLSMFVAFAAMGAAAMPSERAEPAPRFRVPAPAPIPDDHTTKHAPKHATAFKRRAKERQKAQWKNR